MNAAFEPLIRSLCQRDDITPEEQDLIRALPARVRTFSKGEQMVAEHSRPHESCMILQGISARYVAFADGKRQITAVHIAGDFVDLHSLLLKTMDHSVFAVSACMAVFVPHQDLIALVTKAPHLGRLLWLATLVDAAIQRTWISCMGRRSATSHLAHLACELLLRHQAIGLAKDDAFAFPMSQAEIADLLGISPVHVNRVLQELRATGFISWKEQTIRIVDFHSLAELADFDPTYLHFVKEPR